MADGVVETVDESSVPWDECGEGESGRLSTGLKTGHGSPPSVIFRG